MSKFTKIFVGLLLCLNMYLGYNYLKDSKLPSLPIFSEPVPNADTSDAVKPKKPIKPIETGVVDLTRVHQFGYYTSKVDPEKVKASKHKMLIINEADSNSNLFTKEQVSAMGVDKIILAEVSVGYAETYRWYWKKEWSTNKPAFLGDEYTSNQYYVKEWWHKDWWTVTTGIIDKAIDAGFNGVVLDGVDVYIELGASKTMRDKMVDYVIAISNYAKSKNPNFVILPKNAELLGRIPEYAKAIDGLVKEDLIYSSISNGSTGPKNGFPQINKAMNDLNNFKIFEKPVFVIEYVSGKLWEDAKSLIKRNGYVGYSSPSRTPAVLKESVW